MLKCFLNTLRNSLNCCFNVGQPYRLQLSLKCHWQSYIMSYLTSPYKESGMSGAAVVLLEVLLLDLQP